MMNEKKYHKKYDNVYYIKKNYVLKPIYNDKNEYINDVLSILPWRVRYANMLDCTFRVAYFQYTHTDRFSIANIFIIHCKNKEKHDLRSYLTLPL